MPVGQTTASSYNSNVVSVKLLTVGNTPTVFGEMHPLPYVTSMFAGYRGSVNYIVTPSGGQDLDDIRVTRSVGNVGEGVNDTYYTASSNTGATFSQKAAFVNRPYTRQGLAGAAVTSSRTNASVCFNIPDLNGFNFSLVNPALYGVGNSSDGTREQGVRLSVWLKNPVSTFTGFTSTTYAGSGPDFTCLYFVACPVLDIPVNALVPG